MIRKNYEQKKGAIYAKGDEVWHRHEKRTCIWEVLLDDGSPVVHIVKKYDPCKGVFKTVEKKKVFMIKKTKDSFKII